MWHGEVRGYTKVGIMEKILVMLFRWLKLNQVTRIYPYKCDQNDFYIKSKLESCQLYQLLSVLRSEPHRL